MEEQISNKERQQNQKIHEQIQQLNLDNSNASTLEYRPDFDMDKLNDPRTISEYFHDFKNTYNLLSEEEQKVVQEKWERDRELMVQDLRSNSLFGM